MNDSQHWERLKSLLARQAAGELYVCVEDLVRNGLDLTRFAENEFRPCRQDVTQYLAAWGRHAGFPQEACCEWLTDYCLDMLSAISRSSGSRIRHSTKSNVKYIYGSAVPFLCDCEENPFHARCRSECPLHAEMKVKSAERKALALQPYQVIERPPPVVLPEYVPIKKQHREQFEKACQVIRELLAQKLKLKAIVDKLNADGFKTRTGRKWTGATLSREVRELPKQPKEDNGAQSGQ